MITDNRPFDTNQFFAGGAGMFIQYHDVIKPVYLNGILKMIMDKDKYPLPLDLISNMSVLSLIEWYIKRKHRNPLFSLDPLKQFNDDTAKLYLYNILMNDKSIYKLSPKLNIIKLLSTYRRHHMSFPIHIYSEEYDSNIENDIKTIFTNINPVYLYGDLKGAIKKGNDNFTYVFSDIELVKQSAEILHGTCAHILLSKEYRYNYKDNCKTFKYDLASLANQHHYIRIGLTQSLDINNLAIEIINLLNGGDE